MLSFPSGFTHSSSEVSALLTAGDVERLLQEKNKNESKIKVGKIFILKQFFLLVKMRMYSKIKLIVYKTGK